MRSLLLLVIIATTSIGHAQTSVVEREVRQMLDNYFGDIRRDGLMAEMKYLDTSADFFWVPPGYSQALSRDSVVAIITGYAPKVKLTNNTF